MDLWEGCTTLPLREIGRRARGACGVSLSRRCGEMVEVGYLRV